MRQRRFAVTIGYQSPVIWYRPCNQLPPKTTNINDHNQILIHHFSCGVVRDRGLCNSARGNGRADAQPQYSTVTTVTTVTTGRGIESPARPHQARTAWQPRSHAAEFHRKISVAPDVRTRAPQGAGVGR